MTAATEERAPMVTLNGGDLAIRDDQHSWNAGQIAALRQMGLEGAFDPDLQVFFHVSRRTGLDPFARQIYMIYRKDNDAPGGKKATIQTGIDGFRLVAQRAARRDHVTYGYEDTMYRRHDGTWTDCWDEPDINPVAVKVTVLRDGLRFPAIAHWREYVQTNFKGDTTRMWKQMPVNQLSKCAEALALRKAFPLDLSGIYEAAEMAQADSHIDVAGADTPAHTVADIEAAVAELKDRAVAATGDSEALAAVWADARAMDLLDRDIEHEGVLGRLGDFILHMRSAEAPPEPDPDVQDADVVTEPDEAAEETEPKGGRR